MDTFSYAIMGNDEAFVLYHKYSKAIIKSRSKELMEQYPDSNIPNKVKQELIEENYEELIKLAEKQKSRLAYMVLGTYIMARGAKLTDELKKIILKYSDWNYEKHQIENEEDRKERKKHLEDFWLKIKNYDGSEEVKIPLYTVTRVINERKAKGLDTKNIWKKNLDYSIKE